MINSSLLKIISKKKFALEVFIFIFSFLSLVLNPVFASAHHRFMTNVTHSGVQHNVLIATICFFTIQSNIIICIFFFLLVFSRIFGIRKIYSKLSSPYVYGVISMWITITGVVFTFILYPVYIIQIVNKTPSTRDLIVANVFLIAYHMVTPLLVFISFCLQRFEKRTNYFIYAAICFCYPLLYAIIAVTVGHFTSNYPYYFLDPNSGINIKMGHYTGVLVWIIGLLLIFMVVAFFFHLIIKRSTNPKKYHA